ncbi:3-deoxy-D-manno-octulosonic acid kinase [Pusillimonas sp. TS35]|uniref:3-deoxy-D-manno-octulosonic acid kinase n=1 Tax=Paracandidimonas lactea TaxID=2895524 RepID=UPI001368AE53|nr:3-deoxy-D-manno-octulosonic acid kinase [Paracandidimonas lactea]MYN13834.1 3-deoxy-D-manno-octulosonic acid kinase [Pusillimonas sp. TS35]
MSALSDHAAPIRELPLPGAGAMRFDASVITEPGGWLFDAADARLAAQPVAEGGRRAAWFVSGDFGQAVLRRYRRGGMMARLSNDRYVWGGQGSTRSFLEFDVLLYLYRRGLAVPRPLAAAYWRQGLTYRAAILVQRLAGTAPLARCLGSASPAEVAMAVFAIHEAGVWHADLNAYNILLDQQGKVWLIDFDKGSVRSMLSAERRQGNLLRLRRSLAKVAGAQGVAWWEALNHAYAQLGKAKPLP